MRFHLTRDTIPGGPPYLSLRSADSGARAPLVLLLHGLRGRKEYQFDRQLAFASRGFHAVAIDLPLHGERMPPNSLELALATRYVETLTTIHDHALAEIASVFAEFGADRAAILGSSLGGMIAFSALLQEPRLQVAAIALGTPDWAGMLEHLGYTRPHPYFAIVEGFSPLDRAASLIPPRPLLMVHGDADMVVPISGVIRMRDRLAPAYAEFPERLSLRVHGGVGHEFTPEMLRECVDWMARFSDWI